MWKQRYKPIYNILYRLNVHLVIALFIVSHVIIPTKSSAQNGLNLPTPGTMISVSPSYTPAIVAGITVYPDNPLQFDFIIDVGDDNLQGEELRKESEKLISYFMATLTVPEDEMWVNLSPYEKERIIADGLGDTVLGRDMLAQDYILKQLTASMMYPEDELGNEFWQRVYKKAEDKFGTTEIPTNTFNKIWIVPEEAVVYANGTSIFVADSYLKVMMEEDYLALEHHDKGLDAAAENADMTQEAKAILKEVLLPEIEKEVNEGKNFAPLRQIYHSMILATWYKNNLRESLLGEVYVDQNKVEGVDVEDKEVKNKIYNRYVEAFKTGVYDYIREEYDETTQEVIPRKYFSGGEDFAQLSDEAMSAKDSVDSNDWLRERSESSKVRVRTQARLEKATSPIDAGMLAKIWKEDGSLNKDGILLAHAATGFPTDGILRPNSYFGDEPALLRNPRQLVEFSWNNVIHYWRGSSYVILFPFSDVADRQWINSWFTATAHMGAVQLPPGTKIMVRKGATIPEGQTEILAGKGIKIVSFEQKSYADLEAMAVIEGMGYQPTTMYGSPLGGIDTTWNEGNSFRNYANKNNIENLIQRMRSLAEELGIPSAEKTDDYDIGFLTYNMEQLHRVFVDGSDPNSPSTDFDEFERALQRVQQDDNLKQTVAGRRFLQFAQYYRDFYRIYNLGAMEYQNALFYVRPSVIDIFWETDRGIEVEEALRKREDMVRALNETFELGITVDDLTSEDDFKKLVRIAGEKRSADVQDEAMASSVVGGIDFNAGNLNLKEQGQAADIYFTNFPNIQANTVNGVTPIIINIAPIINFPLLIGQDKNEIENKLSSL